MKKIYTKKHKKQNSFLVTLNKKKHSRVSFKKTRKLKHRGGGMFTVFQKKPKIPLTSARPPNENSSVNSNSNTTKDKLLKDLSDESVTQIVNDIDSDEKLSPKSANMIFSLREYGKMMIEIISIEENNPDISIINPIEEKEILWVLKLNKNINEKMKNLKEKLKGYFHYFTNSVKKIKEYFSKIKSPFTKKEEIIQFNKEDLLNENASIILEQISTNELSISPISLNKKMHLEDAKQIDITACSPRENTSCYDESNPYYNIININECLHIFLQRYQENKENSFKKITENKKLAFKLGFTIMTFKTLLNIASLSLTAFSAAATFGVGGPIISTIIDNIKTLLISTNGNEIYFNSTNDCLQLMFPYKLWRDPELKKILHKIISLIIQEPELLKSLPGYQIELVADERDCISDTAQQLAMEFKHQKIKELKFNIFRAISTEFGDDPCIDHSLVLNDIFIDCTKFRENKEEQYSKAVNILSHIDPKKLPKIFNTMQTIIINSALFLKNTNPDILTQIARSTVIHKSS
jgi:hypothetical protein